MKNTYIDTYSVARDRALKKIKNAAKDSDNEVLEDLVTELDPKKKIERESNSQAVRMIVDKCLDEYREGEYDFATTKKMITSALNKIK